MSTMAKITAEVLSFPAKSRALLADLLLDSLEDTDIESVDEAWFSEAKRRSREIAESSEKYRSHSDVMAKAHEALK